MAAQPQQPIFPNELNLALDRLYARLITYVDARVEALIVQARIDKQESIARDNELNNGIRSLADALLILTQRVSNVETTQQTIIDTLQNMQQQISDGFAAQAERHNELMVRVERLERGNKPPATDWRQFWRQYPRTMTNK